VSERERELQAVLAREDQVPFDSYALVVSVFVCAVLAIAGIPAFGRAPGQASLALLVVVAVICLLAATQWLALMIRFGYQAPIPPVLIGVVGILVAASLGGLEATLVVLAGSLALQYAWRIFSETGTRFADVALSATALVLFAFLPAHVLLLRRLPFGPDAFYLWLVAVFAFATAQALLGRPARDGTRDADLSTLLSGVLAWLVASVMGVMLGDPFGLGAGILVGGLVAFGCALGQIVLELACPAPVSEDGRRMRRRPILLDALAPLLVSAPFGYYAIRHVLSG
jgi:hypothetical protein